VQGGADNHRAGLAQPGDDGRAGRGDVAVPHPGRGGRGHATDVDQILERNRHAVQRAAIEPGGALTVGLLRLASRFVGHDEDEGVQPRLIAIDLREASLDEIAGGHVAASPEAAELSDRQHRRDPGGGSTRSSPSGTADDDCR
jgi:hypothetical protein